MHSAIIGLLVGIVAPIGDLSESAVKRFTGVKDSGKLLPGHGGVLDRFDSIMFAVPTVYYYLHAFVL
ncbi:phosphatidate cytidylyltransferase [bacterium BFN5]|nr:phosphatidate cytidylyltransferase [bacterium BFN5]